MHINHLCSSCSIKCMGSGRHGLPPRYHRYSQQSTHDEYQEIGVTQHFNFSLVCQIRDLQNSLKIAWRLCEPVKSTSLCWYSSRLSADWCIQQQLLWFLQHLNVTDSVEKYCMDIYSCFNVAEFCWSQSNCYYLSCRYGPAKAVLICRRLALVPLRLQGSILEKKPYRHQWDFSFGKLNTPQREVRVLLCLTEHFLWVMYTKCM